MAGGRKSVKRQRKASGSAKSPSQIQILKKLKESESLLEGSEGDSEYVDAESSDASDTESLFVSSKNMADKELDKAMIRAFENPVVVNKLITALREEIHESFKHELQTLKENIKQRDDKIQELESKVEGLEMYGRRNGIRIHGIPESADENTDKIVMELASDIGADIPGVALGRSHRVGRKGTGKPRAIIAKFIGHNHKVRILRNKKVLRDLQDTADTEDENLQALRKKYKDVYVNEDLTSKRAGWARQGREWKRAKKIKDLWTRDGVMFVKQLNDFVSRVNSDKDLFDLADKLDLAITIPKTPYTVSTDEDEGR